MYLYVCLHINIHTNVMSENKNVNEQDNISILLVINTIKYSQSIHNDGDGDNVVVHDVGVWRITRETSKIRV